MGVRSGGLVASIVVFAVGAILRFAVTVNTLQHGFNVHTIGVILMIVGAVGAVLSLIGMVIGSTGGGEPWSMTAEATSCVAKTLTSKEKI